MQQSAVPRCVILSVGSTEASGSETPRFHHASRWRGDVAARRARAAGPTTPKRNATLRPATWCLARPGGTVTGLPNMENEEI